MNYISSLRAAFIKLQEPGEFLAQIAGAWRILAVTALVQVVTGVISLKLHLFSLPFNAFWFGGAVSSFPAFLLGLCWHNSASTDETRDCQAIVALYWLLAPIMTLIAWPMAAVQDMVQGVA